MKPNPPVNTVRSPIQVDRPHDVAACGRGVPALFIAAALCMVLSVLGGVARGQIVLDVPPDSPPSLLTNAETLNLHPGGRLGSDFIVGEDAVLNVQGGRVGSGLTAFATSQVNLINGMIGDEFRARAGSTIAVHGGQLGDDALISGDLRISSGDIGDSMTVNAGTTVISGGRIEGAFRGREDAMVRMEGGVVDDTRHIWNFEMRGGTIGELSTSNATFVGRDFRLDGQPVAGLENPGDEVQFTMPERTLFTGVLADGSPFLFDAVYFEDDIRGTVRLVREDPPDAVEVINVPNDPAPYGIRADQTLNLLPGGTLPDHFVAAEGSVLNVLGGRIGKDLEAYGATINLHSGHIGDFTNSMEAFDETVVNVTGGRIDGGFVARSGATVNLAGGEIGGNFDVRGGATFNMTGGRLGHSFGAHNNSTWNLSGGRLGGTLSVYGPDDPTLTIHGYDFRLDRDPVEGLVEPGDEVIIPRLEGTGTLFAGRLADGTPFAIRDDAGQDLYNPVRLVLTEPAEGPSVIEVPPDSPPSGIGQGQTLHLREGGVLQNSFIASAGSVANIEGGRVGDFFQAVDAEVNIRGGQIGGGLDAFAGAEVTISGGTMGRAFDAYPGSRIIIEGTHFSLDGVPFPDLDEVGDSIAVTVRGDRQLQAVLADGSPFELTLEDRPDVLAFGRDYVDSQATLRLVLVPPLIPEPSSLALVIASAVCAGFLIHRRVC